MSSRLSFAIGWISAVALNAQSLDQAKLLDALREGGNVIAMRHGHAPATLPDAQSAHPENTARERQFDEQGRAEMTAMGNALRELRIPVGEVLTSPTFRARQTAHYAAWKITRTVEELGDAGQGMQGATPEQVAYLRSEATQVTRNTNRILITHSPNLQRAFPEWTKGIAEGEALILRPGPDGKPVLLGRIAVGEWPRFKK